MQIYKFGQDLFGSTLVTKIMQTDKSSSAASAEASTGMGGADSAAEQALARRRVLIKGLGKGSAVVAAMVPIQTLAVPVLAGGKLCTVSGAMSGVHSVAPGGAVETCVGHAPSYWANPTQAWPAGIDRATATFDSVFGTTVNATKLADLVAGNPNDEATVFATAYLNSVEGLNFYPYGNADVIAFFKGTHPSITRQAAFDFFRLYMQTGP